MWSCSATTATKAGKKSQAAGIKAASKRTSLDFRPPQLLYHTVENFLCQQNFTAFPQKQQKSRILTRSERGQDPFEYSITELSIKKKDILYYHFTNPENLGFLV